MVNHQDDQRTEAETEAEYISREVGQEELRRAEKGADDANDQGGGADHEGAPLQAVQPFALFRRQEIAHQGRPSAWSCFVLVARISSVTSPAGKCWLNCKARIYAVTAQRSRGGICCL